MVQIDLNDHLQGSLSKALAAGNPKVRSAYMDPTTFYGNQLRKFGSY